MIIQELVNNTISNLNALIISTRVDDRLALKAKKFKNSLQLFLDDLERKEKEFQNNNIFNNN